MAETANAIEKDWLNTVAEDNQPLRESLVKLKIRLGQPNRDLTPRQAEMLLPGALHLQNQGGEEYENNRNFIDQIIAMAGQTKKTED